MLAHTFEHHVARKTVQMHRGTHRQQRVIPMLRDHARDHPRENVACPSRGHPRIPRRVDPSLAIRLNHERSVSLEDDDQFVLARELPRHAQAILLHVGGGTSCKPRHFARMRSDHQQAALAGQFIRLALECIQAVCVENNGNITLAD